ncbi:ABC transporter permease subunit [Clostridium tarantellae]|uniref:ABC transporter permease subunit n=1 Tax=Clostridium tarantellae TaxID=39493 RepID=A0A6I1MMU9_9CLOT|nr:ABC transporter permease subunit [Clostridium tarantellae]MPQ43572.1 ABC transporter permease subunit [Clostridium tarantellae]
MVNLLKSHLFILRKSRTYKNAFIILTCIIIFTTIVSFSEENGSIMLSAVMKNNRLYGFHIGNLLEFQGYLNIFRAALGLSLFIAIIIFFLVGDLVISPYNNGMLKNTICYGHNRYKIYLSNVISLLIGTILLALFTLITSMVVLSLFFNYGNPISKEEVITMIKIIPIWLLILCAICSFYALIATIIKSKATVATGGALFITLVSFLLFNALSDVTRSRIPIYMLGDLCGYVRYDSSLLIFGVNSLMIIVVSTIIGAMIFKIQEVK